MLQVLQISTTTQSIVFGNQVIPNYTQKEFCEPIFPARSGESGTGLGAKVFPLSP